VGKPKRAKRTHSPLSQAIGKWNKSTMISLNRQSDEAVAAALNHHDQRRRHGTPTISVLVGPIVPSLHLFSCWAKTRSRPVVNVRLENAELEAVIVLWVDELVKKHDLGAAAVEWLAQRLNRDAGGLARSLRLMTSHELGVFLELSLPLESGTSVEIIGRHLIEYAATGIEPGSSRLAPNLDLLLEGHGRPWIRVFSAVGELIDLDCLPVLVMSLAKPSVCELERIARLLAELAVAQPRSGLVLLVQQDPFDSFVRLAPASRAKALLLESIVNLGGEDLSVTAGSDSTSVESGESTRDDSVANALESAISDLQLTESAFDNDDARSAAERFLFERLESVAETAGLFKLNVKLDFDFGSNRWMEVDLATSTLKLAIEVDGYHHFMGPEAFRRDRRKDLELQKHGYLVVRVLAEDVVERLEEVMDTILATVAFRRAAAIHLGATP
jgi:very-short-patch-repair endonuclease